MGHFPRIVPWSSYAEYEQVYHWLYANVETDSDLVEQGISRVNAWASRGKVPRAIESTAAFVQVQLRDYKGMASGTITQQELRLLYSMVFVRFVNGMVDPEQTGKFAMSITDIAVRLGLPSWFVELRHGGTHEHLPSLSVLRAGCVQAIAWLNEAYWQYAIKPEKASILNRTMEDSIHTHLRAYKDYRKRFFKGSKVEMADAKKKYTKALENLISTISSDIIREGVIPILLGVGYMVPAGKKKRASVSDMSINDSLVQLWTPLLAELDKCFPGFGHELITAMLQRIDTSREYELDENLIHPIPSFLQAPISSVDDPLKSPSYLLTLACWLKHFVQEIGTNEKKSLEDVTLDDILEVCMRRPNIYTRSVLGSIVAVDADPSSLKPFIRYIDQMLSNSTKAGRVEKETDLDHELAAIQAQAQAIKRQAGSTPAQIPACQDEVEQGAWVLHDSMTWSSCPIGCLPDGKIPCLDLRVD